MNNHIKQFILIVLIAGLYLLVALPLPYVLVDHYSAMLAGDAGHSDVDIHVWLEWAAGSSLSGGKLVFFVSQPLVGSCTAPSFRISSILLASSLQARGPPTS